MVGWALKTISFLPHLYLHGNDEANSVHPPHYIRKRTQHTLFARKFDFLTVSPAVFRRKYYVYSYTKKKKTPVG